ncbi:Clp protease N-terminal domain-containing protein [Bailinhaonella thermotolerans]|uniref:Clp R domain-containing protein n=1 Tax=Bailinhaonella thermotolerans TaxID=1070861 RepID=A0A3A4B0D4_9ACTN|nr:Clp protease N-terminal domain-containing protein [Bailinhaonella thermotolerans]RJL36127.1 hypothetical protein D5H75_05095 [Bailinhaonella thermotolerans]
MFERFTDRARRVVVHAQEEARRFGHERIDTRHLLLGLLREDQGAAAQALERSGVTLDGARAEMEPGGGPAREDVHTPFAPEAKKTLELGLREALHLGHNHIGTEHILLGVIRAEDSHGARLLERLSPGLAEVRAQVLEALRTADPETTESLHSPGLAYEAARERRSRRTEPLNAVRDLLVRIEARLARIEARLDALEARPADSPAPTGQGPARAEPGAQPGESGLGPGESGLGPGERRRPEDPPESATSR